MTVDRFLIPMAILRRLAGDNQEPDLRSNMLHEREVGRKGAKVLKENIPAPN
jgi:hypothetical protein